MFLFSIKGGKFKETIGEGMILYNETRARSSREILKHNTTDCKESEDNIESKIVKS